MAQNNKRLQIQSQSDADTLARAMINCLGVAFYGTGGTEFTDNTLWTTESKSVGIKIQTVSSTNVEIYAVNAAGDSYRIVTNLSCTNEHTLTYNDERTSGIFAFCVDTAASNNASLKVIFCQDVHDTPMIMVLSSSTAQQLITSEQINALSITSGFRNVNASDITMLPVPAFVSSAQIKNLFFVVSSPVITWSNDSTVYYGGDLYKLCFNGGTGTAFAFKV